MTTENQIEKTLKRKVESLGGICYKFTSPGRKNVPDRLCALPNGIVFFVECKGIGGKLRGGQKRELFRLRGMGHHAYVCDTLEQVEAVILLMQRELEDVEL